MPPLKPIAEMTEAELRTTYAAHVAQDLLRLRAAIFVAANHVMFARGQIHLAMAVADAAVRKVHLQPADDFAQQAASVLAAAGAKL